MAKCATLGLNRRVLIDKWASNLCMALHTDGISSNAAPQLLLLERPVRIVTVTAAYQPFVHLVVKGLREGWLDIGVTGVAELWLRYL